MNKKTSSSKMATVASRVLNSISSSVTQKALAGSVLSQKSSSKTTGKAMESRASNVLNSKKYSGTTRSLAASVLAQSDKKR